MKNQKKLFFARSFIFFIISYVFLSSVFAQNKKDQNGYWKLSKIVERKKEKEFQKYPSDIANTSVSLNVSEREVNFELKQTISERHFHAKLNWSQIPEILIPSNEYIVKISAELVSNIKPGNNNWSASIYIGSADCTPEKLVEDARMYSTLKNNGSAYVQSGMVARNNTNDSKHQSTEIKIAPPSEYCSDYWFNTYPNEDLFFVIVISTSCEGSSVIYRCLYKWIGENPPPENQIVSEFEQEVPETIINLYNKSSSPLYTSPGEKNTCNLQADVDCSNPQEKAGRTVRIEFVNQQIGSFNKTEAVTDANGKANFTYTAPDESFLGGKDNIKVEVKAIDVKSRKETYYVPIEIYKRDSKSTLTAEHMIMPQGSMFYNEIKISFNAPPKGTGYSATISTKDPLGLITTSKTDPNGSSPLVDNLVPGKVYTLYYHNTGSSTLSAPVEDEITLEIPELGIKKIINVSVGMDLAVQSVERKYKTGTTYPAVPEPLIISIVDNFHPGADLEKIFNDFDIKMRVRISPSNVSQTSVLSKVQEDWCSRLLTKFEGFMFGENIVTTSGDAIVTIKKSPEGKYTLCKTDREMLPFVMMFDRGTYDFTAELIDIGFPENQNNNSGTISLTVEQYRDGVDEFLKTALIPMAKSLIDITTGGLMKYGDFAATTADLVQYKDAVGEGKLQDAVILLFGMYCDKLGNSKEFFNVLTKEVKPLSENTKRLLELNNLSSNALDLTKLIAAEAPNKGGGFSSAPKDISNGLKYPQLITKGMKDYYFIIMDKSGLKNYSATLKTGSKLFPAADKILNAKSTDERIESDDDYIIIPFENTEEVNLTLDFNGSGGFLYRVTKDKIDKIEYPKNTSSSKVIINQNNSLSLGKQETKKETSKSSIFSGSWETTDFGTVSFIIAGNDVIATCTKNLAGMKGTLSSDGTKITGSWAKFPTYSSPDDAGKFEITVSSDGKSFTGKWGKGTDANSKLSSPLNGKKK